MIKTKMSWIFILALALILNINYISADFRIGNASHSIDGVYGSSKPITGWINISLVNEPESSLLTAFDSKITIKEFMELNDVDYTCNPADCENAYSTNGTDFTMKTFTINERQDKLVGIKLVGDVQEITGISFNISSNSQRSCLNPIKIDILNDGLFEFISQKIANESFCYIEKPYGCFDNRSGPTLTPLAVNSVYCEKIRVPPVRGFRIGAIVNGSGNAEFKIIMRTGMEKECRVVKNGPGEVSCIIELDENLESFTNSEVCIQPIDLGTNVYSINFEDYGACGYSGEYVHDFEIFAKPLKFESINSLLFNQDLAGDSINLATELDDYITNKYNKNCSSGCIIPIKINSGIYQNITIFNLALLYKKAGLQNTLNKFNELQNVPVSLSSDYKKLNLGVANLLTPSSLGEADLYLNLGNNNIFTENITVRKIIEIEDILPHSAPALIPVDVIAIISGNISKMNLTYKWKFGNSSIEETTVKNYIKHVFPSAGNNDVTVKVISSAGEFSKTAVIKIVPPKEAIGTTIKDYKASISNFTSKLDALSPWIRAQVDGYGKMIDIEDLTASLKSIEDDYKEAVSDEEYISVMNRLLALKVPFDLKATQTINTFKYFQAESQLDFNLLANLGADIPDEGIGEEDKSKYYNAINNWIRDNLDATLESKTYTAYYKNGIKEVLFSNMKLSLNPKKTISELYVFINGDETKIKFSDSDLKTKDVEGKGIGITLGEFESLKTIDILYPGRIDIMNLPLFLSPEINELEIGFQPGGKCNHNGVCDGEENYKNCRADCKPWGLTLLFIAILLVIALVIYIILQEWYKRYYESHLFTNKAQLFNLINFMYNSSNQGLKKQEIFDKLKNYKWTNEQLTYAWHRFKGERTGMWEIPIFKFIENKKVKEEIEKRKGTDINRGLNPLREKK